MVSQDKLLVLLTVGIDSHRDNGEGEGWEMHIAFFITMTKITMKRIFGKNKWEGHINVQLSNAYECVEIKNNEIEIAQRKKENKVYEETNVI